MKNCFKWAVALALLQAAVLSWAATLAPVQLLNPTGSTSGQAIVSTGPSTSPAWGGIGVNGIAAIAANTVLANATGSSASPTAFAMPSCSGANSALNYTSGTGWGCGTTFALTSGNLSQFAATTSAQLAGVISDETGTGALVFATNPSLGAATFSGNVAINNSNAQMQVNDTSGTGHSDYYFYNNSSPVWSLRGTNTSTFQLVRYVGGTLADTPISVANSTGTMTLADAVVLNGALSGTGLSNYLASPPAIGGTAANAGSFTTLAASGNDSLVYQNSSGQSIPNATTTTVTNWTKLFDRVNSNFNATTGVFTAPVTGYYRVSATAQFVATAGAVGNQLGWVVTANAVVVAQSPYFVEAANSTARTVSVNTIVNLTAGQTMTLGLYQNTGAALALSATAANNWIAINRVP